MENIVSASIATRQIANLMGECAASTQRPVRDLQWGEFKEWLEAEKDADEETIKTFQLAIKAVGGFGNIRDAMFPPTATPKAVEKFALKQAAAIERSISNNMVRETDFLVNLENVLDRTISNMKIVAGGYTIKPSKAKIKRTVTCFLSDLHIGARLDERECLIGFGKTETARRLSYIFNTLQNYKLDYRKDSELVLILGGDIIQGMLDHDPRDGAILAEQQAEATELLAQVVVKAAAGWPKVTVACTSGNHDRNTKRHKARATHDKIDSFATPIYVAIKNVVKYGKLNNVEVIIPHTPWIELNVQGHLVYYTHGDGNLNPGNPGSSINVALLEKQMNAINIGQIQMNKKPYELFAVGHVHFGGYFSIPGGYDLITNPSLVNKDGYGLSFGHGQSYGQTMWETTEEFVVGDFRRINVPFWVDKDKSQDAITPFIDF